MNFKIPISSDRKCVRIPRFIMVKPKLTITGPRRWTLRAREHFALAPVALWLENTRLESNHIAFAGAIAAAAAGACLPAGFHFAAAALIQLHVLCHRIAAANEAARPGETRMRSDVQGAVSDMFMLLAAGYSLSWRFTQNLEVELGWIASILVGLTLYVRALGGYGVSQRLRAFMGKAVHAGILTAGCLLAAMHAHVLAAALVADIAASLVIIVMMVRRTLEHFAKDTGEQR